MTDDLDDLDLVMAGDEDEDTIAERPSTGKGLRERAKSLSRAGRARLGFGDGAVAGSQDARLSSVLSESTSGAAMELLRKNTPFLYDGGRAALMLVLPTAGDFGGLSTRSRSEEKGALINALVADDIHAVVTTELLDDDAFGIIPDAETLERMSEFSILTAARYRWAVVCDDVDTGELRVFAVPATTMQGALDGPSFGEVCEIASGTAAVGDFVDPAVVDAMLEIYRQAPAGSSVETLRDTVAASMSLMTEMMLAGGYPTSQGLIDAMRGETKEGPGNGRHRAAGPGAPAAPGDDEGDQPDPGVGDDVDLGFGDADEDPLLSDLTSDFVDDPAPEPVPPVVSEPERPVKKASRRRAPEGAGLDPDMLREVIEGVTSTEFIKLRESFSDLLATSGVGMTMPSGVPVGRGEAPEPVEVEPGSEFSHERVVSSAGRRYINEELELSVDVDPYVQRLTSPVPQIEMPDAGTTEWLSDQVKALVSTLNAELGVHHENVSRGLYRRYLRLADLAAADTNKTFDPRLNRESQWGATYSQLVAERQNLDESLADNRAKAEAEVRKVWSSREDQFVADAEAKARVGFTHRNAARIEAEVREAGDRVLAAGEAVNDRNMADFNRLRKIAAREHMDAAMTDILATLDPQHAQMMEDERNLVASFTERIREYIDEHRQSDLQRAATLERSLAADDRYERALAEAREQMSVIAAQADARIQAMDADMARREAEHERQLQLSSKTNELRVNSQVEQTRALNQRIEAMAMDHQAEINSLRQAAEEKIRLVEESRREAERSKEMTLASRERTNVTVMVLMVVMIVVVGVVAYLAGLML